MQKIRYRKRPTKKLREVVESDLLTATERIIAGTLDGFYCLCDEQAYFRVSGDKASVSVDEFEKKLKTDLHPNFFVVYNPQISAEHKVQGHQIGFYVPEYKGFVPLCKVGRSAQREIPANSQGRMVQASNLGYGATETAVIWRGYVAAFEACKAFINDVQIQGINPCRCIAARDFFIYKRMAEEIGGEEKLHAAFEEGRRLAQEEELRQAQELAIEEAAKKAEAEKLLKDVGDFIVEKAKEEIETEEVKDAIQPEPAS